MDPLLAPSEALDLSPAPSEAKAPSESSDEVWRDEAAPIAAMNPPIAPSEDPDPGLAAMEDIYVRSYADGAEIAMDALRSLHPHWNEVNSDTELGRHVCWARTTNDWVYGEPTLAFLSTLVGHLRPQREQVFVDLGCGMGKVTAFASLHFGKALGLELQEPLVAAAEGLLVKFLKRSGEVGATPGNISYARVDFLGHLTPPWQDREGLRWFEIADVAYACCAKFCDETMRRLGDLAAKMKLGAHFVSVRHALRRPELQEIWSGEGAFSWGSDTVFVYQRQA